MNQLYIYILCYCHCLVAKSSPTLLRPHGLTVACQAPLSMGFPRQEHWNSLPLPSPGDLPNPVIELRSSTWQADSLPAEPPGKPKNTGGGSLSLFQWIFSLVISDIFNNDFEEDIESFFIFVVDKRITNQTIFIIWKVD